MENSGNYRSVFNFKYWRIINILYLYIQNISYYLENKQSSNFQDITNTLQFYSNKALYK